MKSSNILPFIFLHLQIVRFFPFYQLHLQKKPQGVKQMILQFKVTLKDVPGPVWRRLQVDGDMTFYEFHKVLQEAFDWLDYHLHSFSIKKCNGQRMDAVEIGSMEDEFFGFFGEQYDEEEEKLSDWFAAEKDRAIYTYDFGDNWEHDIVLETILPPEKGVLYPRCIKAVRLAPEEDSRGELLEGLYEPEEIDSKKLTEKVNESLSSLAEPVDPGSAEKEIVDYSELLQKAKKFNKLKPWERLYDSQVIMVEDPLTGEKMFCCIMGAAEEEFGMAVYIGYEGYQTLMTIFEGHFNEFELVTMQRSILMSFVNRDELESMDYQFIKTHGMSFRGKKQWPQFRSFKPGLYPWLIDEEEARMLQIAIDQVVAVVGKAEEGLDVPCLPEDHKILARIPRTSEGHLVWESEIISADSLDWNKPNDLKQELLVSKLDLKRVLKYKKYNPPIEMDFFRVNMPVQARPSERPHFPMMAVAVERRGGLVIFNDVFEGQPGKNDYQQVFIKMINQLEKVPREIWLKSESLQMLEPLLEKLGMKAIEVKRLPMISEMKELMEEMMGINPF
jgi:hypothetical protein